MNIRVILFFIIALLAVSCNDELSPVGMTVLPEDDDIDVRRDTISYTSSSQIIDSIYVKTSYGFLGTFNDLVYGNIGYGYLTNFYTSQDSVFKYKALDNKIDSVRLFVFARNSAGDSLTTMEASVYGIPEGKKLDRNFYSDVDPWKYASKDMLWAKKTYTFREMKINALDTFYTVPAYAFNPYIKFNLPVSVGQHLYDKWQTDPGVFADLDQFFDFFPGLFVTSTGGSGNIQEVGLTLLQVFYTGVVKGSEGQDSTFFAQTYFRSSEEVIQMNNLTSNRTDDQKLIADKTKTYIKTPSGVITQLEIPIREISERLGDERTFNNVKLSLKADYQQDWKYTLPIPPNLLLIPPDSVKQFFEQSRLPESSYSYMSTLSSSTFEYNFGNISVLIQNTINHLKDKGIDSSQWEPLKLWVMPVYPLYQDSYSTTPYIVQNYFQPAGVTLKTGADYLKLYITTTKTMK